MSKEYITYKYTESYFNNNYSNTNNIIRRRDISNVENQFEKGRCLSQCLKYFAQIDITTVTDLYEHFDCIGKSPHHETRCCCSQHEEDGLNSYVIVHKKTQLCFIIGRVCFRNLFENVPPEQFNKFYQPNCDYCEQKIKVYNKNRPNFCNQKCIKKHCIQEEQKQQQIKEAERKKKWEDEAPLREAQEAERKKKWEDEAPLREAQEEERKKKWEEKNKRIMEANQKYIESQQSKNKKIVYTHCLGCNKPKTCENHQKWPLCYKCNEKKKSLN
jgi:hypothetical protein